jgi:hypothetical protein
MVDFDADRILFYPKIGSKAMTAYVSFFYFNLPNASMFNLNPSSSFVRRFICLFSFLCDYSFFYIATVQDKADLVALGQQAFISSSANGVWHDI